MQQRLPSFLNAPIAFAHRGARSTAPENTIEAFVLGLRLGANGLETDAWLTRDGEVVLDHDGVVRRRGRRTPISTLDLSDLPGHIPTLRCLLESCGVGFDLSIDMKDRSVFEPLLAVVADLGVDKNRLWLCHPELAFLRECRAVNQDVRLVESCRIRLLKQSPEMHCAELADARIDVLNMPVGEWNGGLVTLAHRFGLLAFGWDAQLPRTLRDGLRMGLDAVYSDHVDVMVDVYTEEIGHHPRR